MLTTRAVFRSCAALTHQNVITRRIHSARSENDILLLIHGYPRRYNAGSEVYTQTLALGLEKAGLKVSVCAREEDPFKKDYEINVERDPLNSNIPVHIINHARSNARFANEEMDAAFEKVLLQTRPKIVHMGHLNHLSTGMVAAVKRSINVPIVFTLHDFWLMCPRGQFLQSGLTADEPHKLCDGQENSKCSTRCMNRFYTGISENSSTDLKYWENWVDQRMKAIKELVPAIDMFIAPSEHLMHRFVNEFGISKEKIKYIDYGFDLSRLPQKSSESKKEIGAERPLVFGYIGRHHPSKGIDQLISAFGRIKSEHAKLIIWGRPEGQLTNSLKRLAAEFDPNGTKIEWRSEYKNEHIVRDVFDHCDCIVVPSIWDENSPLVIHEAQQVRIPCITAEHGGMSEFVKDGVNGLTFVHRDVDSLQKTLQKAVDDPAALAQLGKRGYIKTADGNIPSIEEHVTAVTEIYADLDKSFAKSVEHQKDASEPVSATDSAAPWRITFDTNPDDCNLSCIMCEEHSVFSKSQEERKASGKRRRRMDIDTLRKIVAECAPNGLKEIIPSTMGEPLMYKHFPEIVEICKQHNVKMNLTTNGTFLGRGVDEWGQMILPIASDVKISWNGATKETQEKIMRNSRFESQMANLRRFIEIRDEIARNHGNRASITLQLTFLQTNLHEIPAVVRMAISLGVDRVKGHHLWAHFKEIKDQSMRRSPAAIAQWNAIAEECMQIAKENPLANGKIIKLENIFPLTAGVSQIHPDSKCPFLAKEAWVNHEGRFDPCCAPDKERKSLGYFGNATNDGGLLPLWNGPAYRDLTRNYLENELCKGCNMRRL